MKRKLIILLLSLVSFLAAAQGRRTLVGVVRDELGQGLQGAVIYVKSTPSVGVETDKYGNFELNGIPSGKQVIIVSMLGMSEEELLYTGQESAVITLVEQSSSLDDVVVTGIFNKNKETFTGSVTSISEKELKLFKGQNLIQTLKNIDPVINISVNNIAGSDPNVLPDLSIRGNSSQIQQ